MDLSATAPPKGKLYVETDPASARVRILNIGPKYFDGMELGADRYYVEVSADGYELKTQWIDFDAGEDRNILVHLEKIKPRTGRYIAYDNGIVLDTQTNLKWVAGPDRYTNWNAARSWVSSLTIDGGGWRMPTRSELRDPSMPAIV